MMRIVLTSSLLTLAIIGVNPAAVRADQWTGPKEAAQAAREFADATRRLQKAIHDVSEESPLAGEVQDLSKSAGRLHDAVQKGTAYEDALKDYRKIERDYAHFEGGLKKAHDVHHDDQVVAEVKKTKAAFDRLQAQMSGRRSAGGEQTTPRP
jgi:hypothetical protein